MTAKTARLLPAALIVGVALCSAACLEKETRSTAYVEEDGAVTWVIVETGVRSDKPDAAEAGRRKGSTCRATSPFTAPVPLALAAMGGRNLRSEVLRDRVPLATLASARFDGLEDLARSFCSAAAWSCSTRTQRDGALTTWTWTVLPTARRARAHAGRRAERRARHPAYRLRRRPPRVRQRLQARGTFGHGGPAGRRRGRGVHVQPHVGGRPQVTSFRVEG